MWTSPKLGTADLYGVIIALGLLAVAIVWWSSWALAREWIGGE